MTSYQLADLTFSVRAKPAKVEQAIKSVFALCAQSCIPAMTVVVGQGLNRSQFDRVLPVWLSQQTHHLNSNSEPVMVYGPEQQCATVGYWDNQLFCAWTSEDNHRIDFVCEFGKRNSKVSLFPAIINPLLRELYLSRNQLLLHAAGVLCHDDIGMLLIAVSGGGKTTTTLSLVRQGAKLLSDDLIVLRPTAGLATAFGFPKQLNLRSGTIEHFNELQQLPESAYSHTHLQKKSIAPQEVYGDDCMVTEAKVKVIFFIHITDAGPSVRPLTITEALSRFALAHAFCQNQRLGGGSVDLISQSLAYVNTYQLNTGPDPSQLGHWLLQHCAKSSWQNNFPF